MGGGDGASGGGKRKKLWVGLGIGCGVFLLIIGILFAAGAFQAVKCCDTVKDATERSAAGIAFGQEFAAKVANVDAPAAYAMTSEEYRAKVSPEEFAKMLAEHREQLSSSAPRLFHSELDVGPNPSPETLKTAKLKVAYQFAAPASEKMLLMTFWIDRQGEGEEATMSATDIEFDERPRDLALEPAGKAVLELHEKLQRSQYEQAYATLSPAFQGETEMAAFRKFLEDAGEPLTASKLTLREIQYKGDGTQATVVAHAETRSGKSAIIQYEVLDSNPQFPGFPWEVAAIAPLVAEAAPAEKNEVKAADAGAEPSDGTPSEEGEVIAPSVEVDEGN